MGEVARIGVIAAVYVACTLIALLFLGSLAWGPSFRVSRRSARSRSSPRLPFRGLQRCASPNVANIALSGTGMLGLLDVVFGSLATFAGACFTLEDEKHPLVALAGPVIANALIVLPICPFFLQRPATRFPSRPYPSMAPGLSCISLDW